MKKSYTFTWIGIVICLLGLSPVSYAQAIEITDSTPFFEDFNEISSSEENFGLSGWTLKSGYATGSTATKWSVNTSSSNACDGYSLKADDARATSTAILVTPKLSFASGRTAKISFFMNRQSGTNKPNEGFKIYVNSIGDIYNYDDDNKVIINGDQTVTTLSEPILHAKRYAGTEITKTGMYEMSVDIPSEMAGQEFYVIFEAIQEYGNANYIDNIKIELISEQPKLINETKNIDLGMVKAGESASQEFILSNEGINTLNATLSVENGESSPFSVTPTTTDIAFNEQKTITVNFSSAEVNSYTGKLYIDSNGGKDTITLSAETYPATAYYETFDELSKLPDEWVVVKNGNETTYSINSSKGVNGSKCLSGSIGSWGDESTIDTIFTPVISGKVTFDFKKAGGSSDAIQAYIVTAAGTQTAINTGTGSSSSWTTVNVDDVPEGSRIAFTLNNVYVDNFIAFTRQEISKGIQLVKEANNRPSSWMTLYAGPDKATQNTLQFAVKNIGTQTVSANSYNFTTQLVNENNTVAEGVSYKTYIINGEDTTLYEDNVIPGPEIAAGAGTTIKGYLFISSNNEKSKLSLNVKVNNVENTHFTQVKTGDNITIKPNKRDASLSAINFGLVNKATTLDYVIKNNSNNGALTVSKITVPSGSAFSVNAALPLVIPSSKSDTIQITFNAEPGIYNDNITVEHDGIGNTEFTASGTMLSATALLESFEGETFPPILWDMKQGLWERNTTTKHHGKTSIVNTESTVDTIITPLLHLSAGDSIAFSVRATSSSGYNTDILYSADGKTWNLLKSFAIYANYWSDWAEMAAYMPEDFTEGDYYIGFASKKTYIDLVYGPQIVYQEHRIDIKGFTGENKGMVNYTQNFTIDVACLGTAGETAESYSIALMNGEENIGNYTVEPMILGDMKSYTCSWTPRAAGEASIYALLTLDDVVTSTDTITVSVAEESLISTVMIGDLSTTAPSPNYKHYLYETLYTPEDLVGLQAGDVIETVNIPYYATDAAVKGYRINIWIGNTEKTALTTDKMSEADITGLSHIGANLRYEAGGSKESPLYFEMRPETPITYNGGNLSLIVSVDSTSYKSGVYFFTQKTSTKSMKTYSIDGNTSADYMDTWINGGYIPKVAENIMVMELGLATEAPVVHGIVTRKDNQAPIEGATVTMQSGEVIYTATTDETGAYSISVMQPGKEYEMTVSKDNYTGVDGVLVTVNEDTEQNFELTIISGIDYTTENATKIFTDRTGNIHVVADAVIETIKVYSTSGSLCITETPASESAVINAGDLKGIYVVEVQTAGSVKRAKVRL